MANSGGIPVDAFGKALSWYRQLRLLVAFEFIGLFLHDPEKNENGR